MARRTRSGAAAAMAAGAIRARRLHEAAPTHVLGQRARIALRELLPPSLGGAPIETTARELSQLADVTVEVALQEAMNHVAARYGRAEDQRR